MYEGPASKSLMDRAGPDVICWSFQRCDATCCYHQMAPSPDQTVGSTVNLGGIGHVTRLFYNLAFLQKPNAFPLTVDDNEALPAMRVQYIGLVVALT